MFLFSRIQNLSQSKFVRDVFTLQIGRVFSLALAFITSIVLARVLHAETYGLYALIFAFVGLVGIFMDVGAGYATITLLSEAYTRRDREEIKDIITYFIKITLLLTGLVCLVSIILAPFLTNLFYDNPQIGHLARFVFIAMFLTIFYSLLTIVLQAMRQIKYLTILENLNKFFYAFFPICLVILGLGLLGVVLGHCLAASLFLIFSVLIYSYLTKREPLLPNLWEIISHLRKVSLKKYFKFSFLIALNKNMGKFYETLPIFFLGIFSSPLEAGYFKIALALSNIPRILGGSISRMLSVVLPQQQAIGRLQLRQSYYRALTYAVFLVFGLGILVLVGTKIFFVYIYGQEYLPLLKSFYILLAIHSLTGFTIGLAPVLRTLQKVDLAIKIDTFSIGLMLVILWLAIPHWGAVGAALGMLAWRLGSVYCLFKIDQILKSK